MTARAADASADVQSSSSLHAEISRLLISEDTPHGTSYNAALHAVLAIVDRHEQLRQRNSARAIAQRKVEGKRLGGDLPYGYRVGPDGETLIEDLKEQRVIAAARKLRYAGSSLRVVARKLMGLGMFSRNGRAFEAAQIKRMTDEEETR